MDDKTKKDFILLFNQGFEEVILPEINNLREEMESGFKDVELRFKDVEKRFDILDGRLDVVERKMDTLIDQDIDTQKRIGKLENSRIAA